MIHACAALSWAMLVCSGSCACDLAHVLLFGTCASRFGPCPSALLCARASLVHPSLSLDHSVPLICARHCCSGPCAASAAPARVLLWSVHELFLCLFAPRACCSGHGHALSCAYCGVLCAALDHVLALGVARASLVMLAFAGSCWPSLGHARATLVFSLCTCCSELLCCARRVMLWP